LTLREVLRFYLPLVATSQMMTLSTPVINLGLGRAADPAHALASYAVGFTLSVFLNSPALVSAQVSATLVREKSVGLRVLLLTFLAVGLAVGAVELVLGLTPAGDVVLQDIMGIPTEVAASAKRVLVVMSPIPVLLALRGVHQAVAMTASRTLLITSSTLTRLILLSAVVGALVAGWLDLPGEIVGALALLSGIAGEALLMAAAAWLRLRGHVRDTWRRGDGGPREVLRFAGPLFVSGWVWTVQRPLINFVLARTATPTLSLAAFGVVAPLVLLTTSPLWALQPTTIVLPRDRQDLALLHRFSMAVSAFFALALLALAVAGGRALMVHVYELPGPLLRMVLPALAPLALAPMLMGRRAFAQGMLLRMKLSRTILRAALMRLLTVLGLGLLAVDVLGATNGAVIGVVLLLSGEAVDMTVQFRSARSAVRGGHPAFPAVAPPEPAAR